MYIAMYRNGFFRFTLTLPLHCHQEVGKSRWPKNRLKYDLKVTSRQTKALFWGEPGRVENIKSSRK